MSELNYGQFNISQQLAVFVNSLYAKNKCLCFVHKGLCSNPCIQDECLQGLAVGAIRRYPCKRGHSQGPPFRNLAIN